MRKQSTLHINLKDFYLNYMHVLLVILILHKRGFTEEQVNFVGQYSGKE